LCPSLRRSGRGVTTLGEKLTASLAVIIFKSIVEPRKCLSSSLSLPFPATPNPESNPGAEPQALILYLLKSACMMSYYG
jgi:hypothetical protein